MSLAPGIWLAYLGAIGFGALTAAGLAAAMSVLQERLQGIQRVTAFAAFHVMIRTGLALAAVGAGAAADVVNPVHWPVVGRLAATRVVLLFSGLVIIAGAALGRRGLANLEPTPD